MYLTEKDWCVPKQYRIHSLASRVVVKTLYFEGMYFGFFGFIQSNLTRQSLRNSDEEDNVMKLGSAGMLLSFDLWF